MQAKIDNRLNIVLTVEAEGRKVFVHSMPFSKEAFDQNFEILTKTYGALHGEDMTPMLGPRIALKMMKKIALKNDEWEGPTGVEASVLNEIRRTSMVILPSRETILLADALSKKVLSAEDIEEVENFLVFFIATSAISRRNALRPWLLAVAGMWDAQITSLNSTAFAASLPTLSATENTGATAAA